MEEEDNITRQADEVEALSAIYGSEWCVVDEAHRVFCIEVTDGTDKATHTVCLQVTMPAEYPSSSPPHYQINGPWLTDMDRRNLSGFLEDIYCDNIGESIVYLWVERIREFLVEHSDANAGGTHKKKYSETCLERPHVRAVALDRWSLFTASDSQDRTRRVIVSTETDHDFEDDEFDPTEVDFSSPVQDLSPSAGDDWECPPIHHGGTLTDRRSTFQPHLAAVCHKNQVNLVIQKLMENRKIANATHNMLAYRIEHGTSFIQGCDDDGETHAGSRMLHLLQIVDARNVLVVVSRWYGGIHLGADRFKHINNCTRTILQEHNYVKEKDDKKKPRSKKEKKR